MKKLIVVLVVLLLSGCATQKSLQLHKWHVEYLQNDLEQYKTNNIAYTDSIRAIRQVATQIIQRNDETINGMKLLVQEFIIVTDVDVADSLLKKYKISYKFPDGKTIGE